MEEFPPFVQYCGTVAADQSVDVLKHYFVLLFPTYYEGEGFAGTLLDAYSAGVPVIATDWKYNRELVPASVGFTYKTGENEELQRLLWELALNPGLILEKKTHCLAEARKYSVEQALAPLIRKLGRE